MDKNHEVLQRHEIDWEYMLENEIDIRQLLQSRGDYINDPVLRSLPNSSWSLQGRMACTQAQIKDFTLFCWNNILDETRNNRCLF
jgi:hypothetical protein